MNEPFSWLAVFSKLGVPGTTILAVVLGIAGVVGTNVGNVRERATAFFDYQPTETDYHNSDENTSWWRPVSLASSEIHYYNSNGNITNASSVAQVHEHTEIDGRFNEVDGRLTNLEQGQADIYERLTNLEQGQADIYGRLNGIDERFTNLEQGQVAIKADLQGVKADLAELKATLQKLLEKP